jgi:hypothetical protein
MSSLNWLIYLSIYLCGQTIDKVKFEKIRSEINLCYNSHHAEQDLGYKSGILSISEQGFLRYTLKTTYGKTEYYSLKLLKLKDISFLGTENANWLVLNCYDDSVIYQTYQDKDGNIDEMTNKLRIPLKNLNIEDVNELSTNFFLLKALFFANTNK